MFLRISTASLLLLGVLHATTLKEAVQIGINQDPAILSKIAKYDGKKVSVSLAKSGYLPTLDLAAGVGAEENDRENRNQAQSNTSLTRQEASARFRQPIFEGFATSSDVDRSKADKETTYLELDTLTQDKSLQIVKSYFDVLKSEDIIKLAKINLKVHDEILNSISQRYEQGVSDKADYIQIKGRVANAQTDLFSAQNNLLDAKANYQKVVGESADNLDTKENNNVSIPESLKSAVENSLKNNPAILSSKQSVLRVRSQKEATKSANYPHLFGDLSANYKDDADGILGKQENYQAMLRVEWNIFNGFKDVNKREIAQKEVIASQQIVYDTKRQLILETTLSWNAYTLLKKQLVPLQEHVNYSDEVKKLYLQQYNVGRRSLVDVLNAQVESFNAQKALINAQNDEVVSKYRILHSMGTLNENLGVVRAP